MTDSELLEAAAAAAGIELEPCSCSDPRFPFKHKGFGKGHWSPLHDDGDALRLAVTLGIGVLPKADGVRVATAVCAEQFGWHIFDGEPEDRYAAARRAIVRAAAAMVANAPHEGPGAALSRTVPLDAVVGHRGQTCTD